MNTIVKKDRKYFILPSNILLLCLTHSGKQGGISWATACQENTMRIVPMKIV